VCVAIRVENEQLNRDGQVNSAITSNGSSFTTLCGGVSPSGKSAFGNNSWNNDDADAAWKVGFTDGQGHNAIQYFHGVPYYSFAAKFGPPVISGVGNQYPQALQGQRLTRPYAAWLSQLRQFNDALIAQNLGFRYSTTQWTPAGMGAGSTGNGTPLNVIYNYNVPAGSGYSAQLTLPGTYTIQVAQLPSVSQLMNNGRFQVNCRGFKSLAVLNGRHPAIPFTGVGPNAGLFFVNVVKKAAQYAWDQQGYVTPIVWNTFAPAPSVPANSSQLPPGFGNVILTSKKTGRPFDLQRVRSRNRVT